MSFSFLAPWALFAAALLAVPVLIHLFKPRRVRETPFSSLRWLHLSPQKLSRRIQWHQVLLFLLRAAFLSLLVFALARPLLSAGDDSEQRDRFIVLDVSHSMGYRDSGQAAPLDRAKLLAVDLLRQHRPGDRTAVLLTGSQTRVAVSPAGESDAALAVIETIQAGMTGTDLNTALPVIRGLAGKARSNTTTEVWFITDNQQNAWHQGLAAEGMPGPMKIRVVDVGVAGAQNAWITRARVLEFRRPARRVLRVECTCVGDTNQERTVHLDGVGGLPARSQTISLTPGLPSTVDFEVPSALKPEAGVVRCRLEPADALPGDDEFFLNLDGQGSLRVLLVERPGSGADPHPSGHHLRTALESLADTDGQPLRIDSVSPSEARPASFRDADVIFLADVPELRDDALAALEERVRSGAGAAIILGEAGTPAFLNERLHKPLQANDGLLPASVRPSPDNDGQRLPLTSMQTSHPLFAGMTDPQTGDLGLVRFRRWFDFTSDLGENSAVLARIDEEAPAVIERRLGSGRVVILNTGAGDRWCDWPRYKSYIPFIDRLLNHLASTGTRRNFVAGEVVSVSLADWQPGERVTVRTPDDRRIVPVVRAAADNHGLLSFEANRSGVYQVERASGGMPIVVQADRGDSVLKSMDSATLRKWWEPTDFEILRGDERLVRQQSEGGATGLWGLLALLAGVVLLAETYLVHRLCPKASPKLAQNLVAPGRLSSSTGNG